MCDGYAAFQEYLERLQKFDEARRIAEKAAKRAMKGKKRSRGKITPRVRV